MTPDSISNIAHKLRTPLTVIISTVNNLLDGAFGSLNAEQKLWLKKLETHTNNLETLLNEIFDFLKSQSDTTARLSELLEHPASGVGSKIPASLRAGKKSDPSSVSEKVVSLILAVDDEPDILEVIQEGLSSQGFRVITAREGEEAINKAREHHPDLVLMDVHLKTQNGLEVARKIKALTPTFTPVILVTGQDDLREKIAGQEWDADDLLTKPFQMVELFTRVSSMLRMKKLHQELENLGRKT